MRKLTIMTRIIKEFIKSPFTIIMMFLIPSLILITSPYVNLFSFSEYTLGYYNVDKQKVTDFELKNGTFIEYKNQEEALEALNKNLIDGALIVTTSQDKVKLNELVDDVEVNFLLKPFVKSSELEVAVPNVKLYTTGEYTLFDDYIKNEVLEAYLKTTKFENFENKQIAATKSSNYKMEIIIIYMLFITNLIFVALKVHQKNKDQLFTFELTYPISNKLLFGSELCGYVLIGSFQVIATTLIEIILFKLEILSPSSILILVTNLLSMIVGISIGFFIGLFIKKTTRLMTTIFLICLLQLIFIGVFPLDNYYDMLSMITPLHKIFMILKETITGNLQLLKVLINGGLLLIYIVVFNLLSLLLLKQKSQ